MKNKLNIAAEAMTTYGAKGLYEWQLLTALGIPETAAKQLMGIADNVLGNIAKMSVNDISGIKGIGTNKAAAIIAAIELGRRRQVEDRPIKKHISSSADIYSMVHANMRDLIQEEFWIILLDRRSYMLKTLTIHVGGMAAMVVDPKIIFQKALEYKASSVILIHNHPSGGSTPSNEDIRLTEKVKQAGIFLDIKVLDHVIIGEGNYYSFADEGKI